MKKTILITGSSRGIGKDIALYLAKSEYNIVLHCNKNIEQAKSVKDEISAAGRNVRLLQFDISNREECKNILEKDIKTNGMYYGIVLNAGKVKDNPLPIMEDNDWDSVINTNLNGFYNVMKPLIIPFIQQRNGRIIAMTSVSAITGNRGQVNYSASKAGIIGAIKSLSLELAKRKITVNCIAPGIIDTDMTKDIPEEIIKNYVPMKRKGEGREVASLVNYLLSEDAGYITGQVISVNGGMV